MRAEYRNDDRPPPKRVNMVGGQELYVLALLLDEDDIAYSLTREESTQAFAVLEDMRAVASVKPTTPAEWERTPFPRGPKPPRRRTKWTDVETGKQVHIYADTGRRWAHQPPHNEESNEDE